ncbi:MAG: hypothetical protein K9K66_16830 [Desulfarculaceae bacterium]|nr:hypothetical protein [Desulfarculaceae bacterium]MCF8072604.1 hypothetical protein [Desulfarculaceae bacterium]MCF8103324.1 hypothetical protein [Desulfarculaceae bacterium]MCF8118223.1 hypothetical protein [Desulfarculaceae bacterium]
MGAAPDPQALYLDVAARLAAAPPEPLGGAPVGEPLLEQLAAVLARARAVVAALDALLPGDGIDDLNKYEHLAGMLERIARFQSFALAEYTYHLAGGGQPGVRLWLEEAEWRRRIKVLFFPQVGRWQADGQGRMLSRELLGLTLEPGGIAPLLAPELGSWFSPAWGWEECLAMALCLAAVPGSLPSR